MDSHVKKRCLVVDDDEGGGGPPQTCPCRLRLVYEAALPAHGENSLAARLVGLRARICDGRNNVNIRVYRRDMHAATKHSSTVVCTYFELGVTAFFGMDSHRTTVVCLPVRRLGNV